MVNRKIKKTDSILKANLGTRGRNYWSFKKGARREHAHSLSQYPGMMVPQMQTRLLNEILSVAPNVKNVFDPFLGSGTVMTEAMIAGLDFYGQDINPLAVLIAKTKAGPFYDKDLRERTEEVFERTDSDKGLKIEAHFPGWDKWFEKRVAIRLSRIVRSIKTEPGVWCRRFFWVALAETIRLTSNSRTTTFKLHIRPPEEIEKRDADPVKVFKKAVRQNLLRLERIKEILTENGTVERGLYKGDVRVEWGDSAVVLNAENKKTFDLLITSPPYGDNPTTITYGQYSYLPLQWIDIEDIDPDIDPNVVRNTHATDTMSLGGSRRGALEVANYLSERSCSFKKIMLALEDKPRDAKTRVAAFIRDLDSALDRIFPRLRENAYMMWVVGNRLVANTAVPLHKILGELLTSRGAELVTTIDRDIPSKRMALKTRTSATMTREKILIARKT